MTQQHTPTPYHTNSEREIVDGTMQWCVYDNDGTLIASFGETDEGRANALQYVRTSNVHEELVDALETCKRWFEKHSPTAPLITGQQGEHPMLYMLNTAIAKAHGKV